ncbi:MAG: NIPSNAP family protein [Anaerolineales bacterium]|nr:NIPSNAP family protein [Anaerolineales bacterium]
MAVKMLLTWDLLPGREQEYFEFVVRDFIPSVQKMGMEPSDAWFTVFGDQPQIMVALQSASMENMEKILKSSDWNALKTQLLDYIEDFNYKIVPARPGFQL